MTADVDVLCVYYKIDAMLHATWATRLHQFQATLQATFPGLQCELLQRPEVTAGVETWMESYRHPDGLSASLIDVIAQSAAAAELPLPRHTERFVNLR